LRHAEVIVHMEQMDPDPFMELLAQSGLPWHVKEL
jgi:saccharopine dehydrogenase (NAD+, L-lysine-forming)